MYEFPFDLSAGTPTEREPTDIGRCDHCGEPICTGEEYCSGIGEGMYHMDCLESLSTSEWIQLAGLVPQIAEGNWL